MYPLFFKEIDYLILFPVCLWSPWAQTSKYEGALTRWNPSGKSSKQMKNWCEYFANADATDASNWWMLIEPCMPETTLSDIESPVKIQLFNYLKVSTWHNCFLARTKFSAEPTQFCNSILHFGDVKCIQKMHTLIFKQAKETLTQLRLHSPAQHHRHIHSQAAITMNKYQRKGGSQQPWGKPHLLVNSVKGRHKD